MKLQSDITGSYYGIILRNDIMTSYARRVPGARWDPVDPLGTPLGPLRTRLGPLGTHLGPPRARP